MRTFIALKTETFLVRAVDKRDAVNRVAMLLEDPKDERIKIGGGGASRQVAQFHVIEDGEDAESNPGRVR